MAVDRKWRVGGGIIYVLDSTTLSSYSYFEPLKARMRRRWWDLQAAALERSPFLMPHSLGGMVDDPVWVR